MGLFSKEVETEPKFLEASELEEGIHYALHDSDDTVMKVATGWVYRSYEESDSNLMVFIPDPNHKTKWRISE